MFSFVMKQQGWDFPEALRVLADRAGVELAPLTPQQIRGSCSPDNRSRMR